MKKNCNMNETILIPVLDHFYLDCYSHVCLPNARCLPRQKSLRVAVAFFRVLFPRVAHICFTRAEEAYPSRYATRQNDSSVLGQIQFRRAHATPFEWSMIYERAERL